MRKYIQIIDRLLNEHDERTEEELDELSDLFRSEIAGTVYKMFRNYKQLTNNYSIPAHKVFSSSDLVEIQEEITTMYNTAKREMLVQDQAYKLTTVLHDYFIDGTRGTSIVDRVIESF
jgi:hypothetical protein